MVLITMPALGIMNGALVVLMINVLIVFIINHIMIRIEGQ